MLLNTLINQEVLNSNSEKGIVISFDEEHIIIKYPNKEATYVTDIVLKNGFITFINPQLNKLVEEYKESKKQEELDKQAIKEKIEENAIELRKRINEMYKKLYYKNGIMKALFGYDFLYPPYNEFKKKYKNVITEPGFSLDYYPYWRKYD